MSNPGSAHPALSDAALRETLDLLGTVVANMAGKLDRHGQILAEVQKVSAEGRDAAQAAKAHSDPQRYGRHIGQELDKALDATLDRLEGLQSGFATDRQETRRSLNDLVRQEEAVLQHLRDDLEEAGRWKKRIPFIALFGLVLALGLTIALPRFVAGNGFGCAVLGGEWLKENASGRLACVFYGK
jgi:ABC-type transporter Mla subunit MlaD